MTTRTSRSSIRARATRDDPAFAATVADVLDHGPAVWAPVTLEHQTIGLLLVGASALAAAVADAETRETGQPSALTSARVAAWLVPIVNGAAGVWVPDWLRGAVQSAARDDEARSSRRPEPDPLTPAGAAYWQDRMTDADAGPRMRDRLTIGLAGLQVARNLERPARAFGIRDRDVARLGLAPEASADLTLGQFIGMAVDRGDRAALAVVLDVLSENVRAVKRGADKRTILERFQATRQVMRPVIVQLRRSPDRRQAWSRVKPAVPDLSARITRAGLEERLVEELPSPEDFAAALVAVEHECKASSVHQWWKRRRQILPQG